MKTLISVLIFILANNSFADDMRYYDVEIVIIENLSEEQRNSENWPLQVNLVQAEKTVQLGQPVLSEWLPEEADAKISYKVLNSSHYKLNSEVEKISESDTQRVIFHTMWRQPGLDKKTSIPVYFIREIPAPPVILQEEAKFEIAPQNTIPAQAKLPSTLEGILRVTLARYLHLEAELTFKEKVPEVIATDNPFSILDNESERNKVKKQGVIHFKQKRNRMRSNETHYLDHPVLSILVRMTPYKKPQEG